MPDSQLDSLAADNAAQSIMRSLATVQAYLDRKGDVDPAMLVTLKRVDDTLSDLADTCQ